MRGEPDPEMGLRARDAPAEAPPWGCFGSARGEGACVDSRCAIVRTVLSEYHACLWLRSPFIRWGRPGRRAAARVTARSAESGLGEMRDWLGGRLPADPWLSFRYAGCFAGGTQHGGLEEKRLLACVGRLRSVSGGAGRGIRKTISIGRTSTRGEIRAVPREGKGGVPGERAGGSDLCLP